MGWTTSLLTGFAEHLHAHGVGTYLATGAYPTSTVAPIILGLVPASHDRVIVLRAYGVSDDPHLTDGVQGVQVRFRGRKDLGASDVDDLADDTFEALHGLHGVELGGVPVVLCRRTSWTPLGDDDNRRAERTDNYHLNVMRPSPHRID